MYSNEALYMENNIFIQKQGREYYDYMTKTDIEPKRKARILDTVGIVLMFIAAITAAAFLIAGIDSLFLIISAALLVGGIGCAIGSNTYHSIAEENHEKEMYDNIQKQKEEKKTKENNSNKEKEEIKAEMKQHADEIKKLNEEKDKNEKEIKELKEENKQNADEIKKLNEAKDEYEKELKKIKSECENKKEKKEELKK